MTTLSAQDLTFLQSHPRRETLLLEVFINRRTIHLLWSNMSSMFPNISEEFIDELLMANEFDINLTIDMLHELNSQNMLHDEAEMGLPTFPVINNLPDNLGLPGGDDVSKSSSNLDQALQNDKPATTPDVKSVLPNFPDINLLHDNLGQPDDDKSARTCNAN